MKSDEERESLSQNFTPIQSRKRLPQPICSNALCPSMDLIALGLGASNPDDKDKELNTNIADDNTNSKSVSSMIIVYRTISWQKMFTITQSDLASAAAEVEDESQAESQDKDDNATNKDDYEAVTSTGSIGATNLIWSPDGRILAIALVNGSTLFYDIESCASPGVPPTPIYALPCPPRIPNDDASHQFASPILTRSMTAARKKRLLRMAGKTPSNDIQNDNEKNTNKEAENKESSRSHQRIKAIHWQRIRHRHTAEWHSRKYYVDRSTHFLPPCHYTMEATHGAYSGEAMSTTLTLNDGYNTDGGQLHAPMAKTPLSILMTLSDDGLVLYLNGRYRLLSTANDNRGDKGRTHSLQRELVSTSDFHILASTKSSKSMKLVLYSIPTLVGHRYNLQFISSSYGSITNHLTTMRTGMEESYGAWGSSLRQLDIKFDQLMNLMKKYNVIAQNGDNEEEALRLELLNYILGGHSMRSADSSNAMDQFFTHPLMNDQLLIRLFRSLEANVAGVEGLLRRKVLGPVRSLVFDTGELHGLVKTMNTNMPYKGDGDLNDDDRNQGSDFDGLPALMDDDTCMRLCEAAEILYIVSEQCVAQTVEIRHRLECITRWIRGTASQVKARGTAADSVQRENAKKRRVPEHVLRKVASFLSSPLKSAPSDLEKKRGSTECMLGILLSDYFAKDHVYIEKTCSPLQRRKSIESNSDGFHSFVETPSLKIALEVTKEIAVELFDEPRKVMKRLVNHVNITVEECSSQNNLVSTLHSRFIDKTGDKSAFSESVHWTMFANTCSSGDLEHQLVQITGIPACYKHHPKYYKTLFLSVPLHLKEMKFYGDDGNSTLTSESSPSYKEGRQSLSLLLKEEAEDGRVDEELWLFAYDELPFQKVEATYDELGRFVIRKFDPIQDSVEVLTKDEDIGIESKCKCGFQDDLNVCKFIFYKSHNLSRHIGRCVRSKAATDTSSLIMSGSRGIGGLTCKKSNTIDLFDLEEDEDDSDDDESSEEE